MSIVQSSRSFHVPFWTFHAQPACSHFELLGAPIGSAEYCAQYIESKRKNAFLLLSLLPQLSNPQVAVTILRSCASFCKLAHLARSTPLPMSEAVFSQFDNDVLHCFELSAAIELTLPAAKQATLNLSHGGLGLRSLHRHTTLLLHTSHL